MKRIVLTIIRSIAAVVVFHYLNLNNANDVINFIDGLIKTKKKDDNETIDVEHIDVTENEKDK